MALGFTPTIAICLTAGVAAGIALARPDDASRTADTRYESTAETGGDPVPGYGGPAPTTGDGSGASDPAAPPASSGGDVATTAGGDGGAVAPAAITIAEFVFDGPAAVAPNAPIAVTNLDGTAHTLTSRDDLFDTGRLDGSATASIAAPGAPGEYEFFCEIHPSMQGVLVVG